MRILMTTDTIGGVWTFTQELAGTLLKHGCAICLVGIGDPPDTSRQKWCHDVKARWRARFEYHTINAPLEWMEENDRSYRDAAPQLLHLADQFGAELFHANQFCFGALPIDIPKVITAHSDVYSWADCCRGGVLRGSPWLSRYSAHFAKGLRDADAVVTPTAWMASALVRNVSVSPPPVVIPNGRSLPHTTKRKRKLQAVVAGRLWDEAKNIGMLAEVRSPMPLFIAGATQRGRNSENVRLPSGATFVGSLSSDDLLALFSESAIYLCTSKYEPFGLAPLEAALCGCAIVANDIPSLREVWGSTACYFTSAADLATLLDELCQEPDRLDTAQQRSMTRAQMYTAERMSRGYLHPFSAATRPGERRQLCRVDFALHISRIRSGPTGTTATRISCAG